MIEFQALDSALKQMKNKANMVFSVDNDNQKVICLASVDQVNLFFTLFDCFF